MPPLRMEREKEVTMQYKYVGDGAGVPGLPHEITDAEAEELGVTDLLLAAVENGSYAAVQETSPVTKKKMRSE